MKRPTDKYNEIPGEANRRLVMRGGLVLAVVALVGTLAGWTRHVNAGDTVRLPDVRVIVSRLGSLGQQLDAAHGEVALAQLQLDRANAIMANSSTVSDPGRSGGCHLRHRPERGDRSGARISAGEDRERLQADARSSMGALGYTQLQLATARFYEPEVTEKELLDREVNLRIGFRFLSDLLEKFDRDTHLALLAYNRGPTKVTQILARGRRPDNGYSEAVLKGYRRRSIGPPIRGVALGWES